MPTPTQINIGGILGRTPRWEELTNSDSGEETPYAPRSERRWIVTGTLDVDLLLLSAPNNIPRINERGRFRHVYRGYRYDPIEPTIGNGWIVVASYAWEVEYFELNFDTSGGTSKVMVALDDGDYYNCVTAGNPAVLTPTGQDTVDFNRLVGVNGDNVDGVEVPDGRFDFTVLIRNRFESLPSTFINTVKALTGKVNDRAITISWKNQVLTFGTEELLFLGCPGKLTSEEGFEFTLKFSEQKSKSAGSKTTAQFTQPAVGSLVTVSVSASPASDLYTVGQQVYIGGGGWYRVSAVGATTLAVENLGFSGNAAAAATIDSGASVGADANPIVIGNSTPVGKRGWRYLWVNAERAVSNGTAILQPRVAVVNKVIPTADFSPLGIFGTP